MSIVLAVGTFAALLAVIFAGLTHFDLGLYTIPKDEFRWSNAGPLAKGLGAAMTFAVYDYLGYYNICHLGDEVRDPARTIPRAVNRSIWIVAILYLTMNLSILGVIPWQEAMHSKNIAADVMERVYGRPDRGGLHVARRVGRRCVHVFDHAGLLAHSVRRGPAGGFLLGLRAAAPPRPLSGRLAAHAGRLDGRLLLLSAAAGH